MVKITLLRGFVVGVAVVLSIVLFAHVFVLSGPATDRTSYLGLENADGANTSGESVHWYSNLTAGQQSVVDEALDDPEKKAILPDEIDTSPWVGCGPNYLRYGETTYRVSIGSIPGRYTDYPEPPIRSHSEYLRLAADENATIPDAATIEYADLSENQQTIVEQSLDNSLEGVWKLREDSVELPQEVSTDVFYEHTHIRYDGTTYRVSILRVRDPDRTSRNLLSLKEADPSDVSEESIVEQSAMSQTEQMVLRDAINSESDLSPIPADVDSSVWFDNEYVRYEGTVYRTSIAAAD
ncbi:MAG: hypothetical protein ACOCYZ_03530 [Halococcoides sp.]